MVYAFVLTTHQALHAQATPNRFDVVPIQSGVYKQTLNAFVYTSGSAPTNLAALPTVYVPGVGQRDSTYFQRLDKMMQEGAMPYMRIVGIERSGSEAAETAPEMAAYHDPKGKVSYVATPDESYYRFINSEVIPAIEEKYKCASFKALCIDEASPFGSYILDNQSRSFNAYLSLTPFLWFNTSRRPETAKAFFAYYAGLGAVEEGALAVDMDHGTDELYLKTGKRSWLKEK
jgi:predicted alpha/beta superfamily hydrolase